jgi:hypothetical protein
MSSCQHQCEGLLLGLSLWPLNNDSGGHIAIDQLRFQSQDSSMKQVVIIVAGLLVCGSGLAGTNLVTNGSFDDARGALFGWKSEYDAPGESWYGQNKDLVSVIPENLGHKNVLRLHVATQFLADFPGVKVDSEPIAVKPGIRYRFSAKARSTGPDCRIMIEGYHWKPGVKPHDNPTLADLRRCYRFKQLYFGDVPGGTTGGLGGNWTESSRVFPEEGLTDLARKSIEKIQFIVIHIVAITGKAGEVFVDDVRVEPMP